MNILFKNEKEKDFYEDFKKLRKKFGPDLATRITKRISQIEAFESVGDLLDSKLGKGHYLNHDYKNCIGLSLTGNYRLIIEPTYNEGTDFSQLDNYNLKIVTILKVEDYHGK
ncbi:hypothetical protein [Bacillus cereus]|uniref:hypothetical protein n=1 Tax=Bacillus cereus TaxID=1396 RepID=UPI002AC1C5FE|nr:hypothetical protein [Bacillus cereus]MDZ4579780.1 hypothetical protein [Bacillus cereus]